MNILECYKNQIKLYEANLDFSPWERWSVHIEDDRDHFVSGNFKFCFLKIHARLWGLLKVGKKRQWRLIRHQHKYL